ncbi:hypothetical protein [Latilactobacillus curvatus]
MITYGFDGYTLAVYDKHLPHNVGDSILVTFTDSIGFDEDDKWLTMVDPTHAVDVDGKTFEINDLVIKESRKK